MNLKEKILKAKKNYKIISSLSFIFIISFLSIGSYSCNSKTADEVSNKEIGWDQVPGILKNIIPPKFPDKDFLITDYGAVSDGKTLSTEAFKKAIEACNNAGGGRVVVPEGEFLTGAIHLKSNVNLFISQNAVLKFSVDPKVYLPVVLARWEGMDLMNYSPLIYAYKQKNIAVTGKGTLDGQAANENWWSWKGKKEFGWKEGMPNDKTSRSRLMKMNDDKIPVEKRIFGNGYYLRPTFVEFYKCENILIKDVTLKDAPFWFLHPVLSNNITIEKITTLGLGPNNDGCDPESSSNILIKGCTFKNGDDCIAIKSGRNNDGRRINVPSKNIIIQNCKMKDGHGGVVIGSEITGGCWNVFAENCEMDSPELERALRIKTNSKRGGIVKNIFMRNVKVGQVKDAVVKINLHYDQEEAEGYKFKPEINNIVVENVLSQKSKYALFFDGLENSKIQNVKILNCKFNGIGKNNHIKYVENLFLENVFINGELQKD